MELAVTKDKAAPPETTAIVASLTRCIKWIPLEVPEGSPNTHFITNSRVTGKNRGGFAIHPRISKAEPSERLREVLSDLPPPSFRRVGPAGGGSGNVGLEEVPQGGVLAVEEVESFGVIRLAQLIRGALKVAESVVGGT